MIMGLSRLSKLSKLQVISIEDFFVDRWTILFFMEDNNDVDSRVP